jgi:hypothetical protein
MMDHASDMIPYTVNEIRRLWATATAPQHPRRHTRACSDWRRRHQLRARHCHYQRRLKDHESRL